jgi:hypothetical protein
MVAEIPKTVEDLRKKMQGQRVGPTGSAEARKAKDLEFIADALLLLLEQRAATPK